MPEFKPRVVLKPRSRGEMPISEEKLTTGEPDAGDPHVRFGGRGGAHAPFLPLSYRLRRNCVKPVLTRKNFAGAGSSVKAATPIKISWLFVYFVVKKISQLRFNELAIPSVEAATPINFRGFSCGSWLKKYVRTLSVGRLFVRGTTDRATPLLTRLECAVCKAKKSKKYTGRARILSCKRGFERVCLRDFV